MRFAGLQGWIASIVRHIARPARIARPAFVAGLAGALLVPPAALAHRQAHRIVNRVAHDAPAASSGPLAPGIDWVVMDVATGKVLSEHNEFNLRYPASLTKLMTLDLAFAALHDGHLTANTAIPVSHAAAMVQPVKLDLRPGQTVTVEQAMLGMATLSANDAATALGQYMGGGDIDRFARTMTARAHQLGMNRTEFRNPSGLPNDQQVTDAFDMAMLARHILLAYPQYRYIFALKSFDFEGRTIPNIDGMLKRYKGTIGLKTGYTNRARFNLVTAAVRDGHMLLGVEMHASSWHAAYDRMAELLDAGFAAEHTAPHTVVALNEAKPVAPKTMAKPAARRVLVETPVRAPAVRDIVAQTSGSEARGRETGSGARTVRVAHAAGVTQDLVPGWTAQVGAYYSYKLARRQALRIQHERTIGIARVDRAVVDHHRIWRAQLAGLDEAGARQTCLLLKRHHKSCFIIAPRAENLAMR